MRTTSKRNLAHVTSFGHFTLILSLHYLVKCRSHSLAIYCGQWIHTG